MIDSCDGTLDPNVHGAIVSISSDEPEDTAGGGDGRVYTVEFTVAELSGNAATATCKIRVPHDADSEGTDDGPGSGYTVP